MKSSINGLVIYESKTKEADRVVTILSETGIITAYAAGSLRPKNKLTSTTALLAFSNFELYSGKNMYQIDDAVCINRFVRLYSDSKSFAVAAYFCELLKNIVQQGEIAKEYLPFALNALYMLNSGTKPLLLIKAAFEFRLISMAGFMPDIGCCDGCGSFSATDSHFDFIKACYHCENCANDFSEKLNCKGSSLSAMKYIASCDVGKIYSFDISESAIKNLSAITSNYLLTHIGIKLNTLDFLNMMLDT